MENLGYKEGWSRRSVRVRSNDNQNTTSLTAENNEEWPKSRYKRYKIYVFTCVNIISKNSLLR